MSNPSFSNIDRWLFELMEGNLSPEQKAQLEAFLFMHPELDVELNAWEMAKVDSDSIHEFPDKQKLRKRRPIGLYSLLSFTSMLGLIAIGMNSTIGDFSKFKIESKFLSKSDTIDLSFNHADTKQSDKLSKLNDKSSVNSKADELNESIQSEFDEPIPAITNAPQNSGLIYPLTLGIPASDFTNQLIETDLFKSQEISSQKSNSLKIHKAIPIHITNKESDVSRTILSIHNQKKFATSEYHLSVSSRLGILTRRLQRMLDNPVALKNLNDPYYHVPGMQSNDVNFAAVGTFLATRVQTVSRAQWLGKSNQQFINQISVDGYSYAARGGVGFQLNHNYYGNGLIENYQASFTYSPKLSISREIVLQPAVRFKMGSKMLGTTIQSGSMVELDRMNAQQFYSLGQQPVGRTLWYRDLGLGLMVNTKWFYASIQQDNIFKHFDNIYSLDIADPRRAPKHFVASVGTDYQSSKQRIMLSPYLVYQKEDQLAEAWAGFNFTCYWLNVGGAISSKLEPAASVGIKFKRFMLQYNADFTNSQLYSSKNLSHQITLRFLTKPSRVGQRLLNQ